MNVLIVLGALAVLGAVLVGLGIYLRLQSPKSPINHENRAAKAGKFFTHHRDLELQAPRATGVPDPQPEPLV